MQGQDVRRKPRALDLFCCQGGVSAGLVAAGYDVTGVADRPDYRAYGELKRRLEAEFAALPPADYERAIAIIARATGV